MASHKLRRDAAKQEAAACPSVRANPIDDQIGMPLCGRVDDLLSDVTYYRRQYHIEASGAQPS